MALLTEGKINQFGVEEEYWRIISVNLNLEYQFCDITLGGYSNAKTRQAGLEPMNLKKVRAKWDDTEFIQYFTSQSLSPEGVNIYTRSYEYVKLKDEYFKDAIDC